MKKCIISLFLVLSLLIVFSSCTGVNNQNENEKLCINLGLLKGPTGMGAAYLLENNAEGKTEADYNLNLAASPDIFTAGLISGEIDIAALPVNTASVLYNKTDGGIKILCVNTLGVMYILSKDSTVSSITDLSGKTVLSAGQGTTTEYALDYILQKNGLSETVNVDYASEHAEVVTNALSGEYETVLLPEPFVTQLKMKTDEFVSSVNLTYEWNNLGAGEMTQGCFVIRTAFLEEHPDAAAKFLKDFENSVNSINKDYSAAAELIEKYDIAASSVAQKALPNCNIVFMKTEDMKSNTESYLNILFDYNPSSVGGKLPADDFWFAESDLSDAK